MHHGYVQVQFAGEIKNCRRQQLTLMSDGPGPKRAAQDRPECSAPPQGLSQRDSEASSGGANSGASPTSYGSPTVGTDAGDFGSMGDSTSDVEQWQGWAWWVVCAVAVTPSGVAAACEWAAMCGNVRHLLGGNGE